MSDRITKSLPPSKASISFEGVSPVLMSSSVAVTANSSNAPSLADLVYPYRKALWIEEIRWTLRLATSTALNLGALVYSKMQLGRHFLARDATPIWLHGTRMAASQEVGLDTALATDTCYSHYRWRLPEPLYLEAGQVLTPTFSRGNDGFGSITVQVTYVGRTAAPRESAPKIIRVPYVAPFVTTLTNVYQQSNERHLFNPFEKPLRVQRLTGRMLSFTSGTTCQEVIGFTPATTGALATVLINDSWGGKMVNDRSGPADVFDIERAAWLVDTEMPAKGLYEVKAWNITAGVGNSAQLHVGLIGSREEVR